MHNFNTILRFELVRTLKKPTFWLSILSIPTLIGIVLTVIVFAGQTSDQEQEKLAKEPFSLVVDDQSKIVSDESLAQLNATRINNKQQGIDLVKKGEVEAFFYYPTSLSTQPIEVFNKNEGIIDNAKYTSIAESLIKIAATSAIKSPDLLSVVAGQTKTNQTNFESGEPINPLSKVVVPAIFLIIFYTVILLLGSQMLTSTTEEKENRVTEMLLTSVSSRALIIGKIVSLVILGFVQILVILIPSVIAYFVAREALNIPDLSNFISSIKIELWPTLLGAGVLISGFLLFTGLLVAIGAAMPTAKEAGGFFGFTIMIMVVPFWFFSLLMTPTTSPVVTALTYFPLTAPFTLLIRNAFGTLPVSEAIIGFIIVTIAGIVAISLAIRIFRYGTLEYSKRLSLATIFKRK